MRHAYDSMRATAIEGMALIEALIDFGEDEGISDGVFEQGAFSFTCVRCDSTDSSDQISLRSSSRKGYFAARSNLSTSR